MVVTVIFIRPRNQDHVCTSAKRSRHERVRKDLILYTSFIIKVPQVSTQLSGFRRSGVHKHVDLSNYRVRVDVESVSHPFKTNSGWNLTLPNQHATRIKMEMSYNVKRFQYHGKNVELVVVDSRVRGCKILENLYKMKVVKQSDQEKTKIWN